MIKWVLLILSLIALIFAFMKPQRLPKIIWILWFQGWDKAPWLSQKCAESWKKLNPGWEVRLIDEKNCPVPIYGDTAQARSDVVRLELLSRFGGVWADSTMLCMQPLDSWVWKDIEHAGVWMYHGFNPGAIVKDEKEYKPCEGIASWFIVAKQGNYMMNKWVTACRAYWKDRKTNDNYFWMDKLWYELYEKDSQFKELWKKVPMLCCEDPGQSHALAGKVDKNDPELKESLTKNPPRAIKLSNHQQANEDSNAYHLIKFLGLVQ